MKSQYLYAFDIHKHGILRMLSRREHVCKFEHEFVEQCLVSSDVFQAKTC